jgi:hypothetical protein
MVTDEMNRMLAHFVLETKEIIEPPEQQPDESNMNFAISPEPTAIKPQNS